MNPQDIDLASLAARAATETRPARAGIALSLPSPLLAAMVTGAYSAEQQRREMEQARQQRAEAQARAKFFAD